jgi:hypothetical protein
MQYARKKDDLPTYLRSWDPEDQVSKVSSEIIQPMQPPDHRTKKFPPVLNHVKQKKSWITIKHMGKCLHLMIKWLHWLHDFT